MVDLYKRVIDGVGDLGFPLSIHFEATYGVNSAAFDTFAEMLAYWSPDPSSSSIPAVGPHRSRGPILVRGVRTVRSPSCVRASTA